MSETKITVGPHKLTVRDGFNIAGGVGLFVLLVWVFGYAFDQSGWGPRYDDSDNPPVRSGVRIVNDKRTGCQYFQTWAGGITPRMDAAGKQVCLPEPPR